MNDTILDVLLTERPRLTRSLQRRFGWSSHQTIDDAISDAIASALIRPAPYERALAKDGRKGVKRMFFRIALRRHHDAVRRLCVRRSAPIEAIARTQHPPGQGAALRMRQVGDLIDQACLRFGHGQSARLRDALQARFLSGESDAAVARDFGLPREYLNRARCYVLEALDA